MQPKKERKRSKQRKRGKLKPEKIKIQAITPPPAPKKSLLNPLFSSYQDRTEEQLFLHGEDEEPQLIVKRFIKDLNKQARIRLKLRTNQLFNDPDIRKKYNSILRIGEVHKLKYLLKQRETRFGVLKIETYKPTELIKRYKKQDFVYISNLIKTNKGILNMKQFILLHLKIFHQTSFNDLIYLLIGVTKLYLNICIQIPNIQAECIKYVLDIIKEEYPKVAVPSTAIKQYLKRKHYTEMLISINRHFTLDINKFIKIHLDQIMVTQKDIATYLCQIQRLTVSSFTYFRLIEEKNESSLKNSNKHRGDILYTYSDPYDVPKIRDTWRFSLNEGFSGYHTLHIKCLEYHTGLDSVLILYENSKEIKVLSMKKKSEIAAMDMEEALSYQEFGFIFYFTLYEWENVMIVSTSKKRIFCLNMRNKPKTVFGNKVLYFNKNVIEIEANLLIAPLLHLKSCSALIGISDDNNIFIWHSVLEELNKPLKDRRTRHHKRVKKIWDVFYTPSLCEFQAHQWFAIATLDKKIIFIDPMKVTVCLIVNSKHFFHSLKTDQYSSSLNAFGYDKDFMIYEVSKYFKEQYLGSSVMGHISIIVAAEIINELNLLITCDDLGIVKTWDLSNKKAVQSSKLKAATNISRIVSLGSNGFILMTSILHFFKFEQKMAEYLDPDEIKKEDNQMNEKSFNAIPCIRFGVQKDGVTEFVIGTSNELRLLNLDNGLMNWRYSLEKVLLNPDGKGITAFIHTRYPFPGLILGFNNGLIIFIPEKNETRKDNLMIREMMFNKNVSFGRRQYYSIMDFLVDENHLNVVIVCKKTIAVLHLGFDLIYETLRVMEIRLGKSRQRLFPSLSEDEFRIETAISINKFQFLVLKLSELAILILDYNTLGIVYCHIEPKIDRKKGGEDADGDGRGESLLNIDEEPVAEVDINEIYFISSIAYLEQSGLFFANFESHYIKIMRVGAKNGVLSSILSIIMNKENTEKSIFVTPISVAEGKLLVNGDEDEASLNFTKIDASIFDQKIYMKENLTPALKLDKNLVRRFKGLDISKLLKNNRSGSQKLLKIENLLEIKLNLLLKQTSLKELHYFLAATDEYGVLTFMVLDLFLLVYQKLTFFYRKTSVFYEGATFATNALTTRSFRLNDPLFRSVYKWSLRIGAAKLKTCELERDLFIKIKTGLNSMMRTEILEVNDRVMVFTINIELKLKVWDASKMAKDILEDYEFAKGHLYGETKFLKCYMDIATNTVYSWGLYFNYRQRLVDESLLTVSFIKKIFGENILVKKKGDILSNVVGDVKGTAFIMSKMNQIIKKRRTKREKVKEETKFIPIFKKIEKEKEKRKKTDLYQKTKLYTPHFIKQRNDLFDPKLDKKYNYHKTVDFDILEKPKRRLPIDETAMSQLSYQIIKKIEKLDREWASRNAEAKESLDKALDTKKGSTTQNTAVKEKKGSLIINQFKPIKEKKSTSYSKSKSKFGQYSTYLDDGASHFLNNPRVMRSVSPEFRTERLKGQEVNRRVNRSFSRIRKGQRRRRKEISEIFMKSSVN